MKTTITTINPKHYNQLSFTHNWDGTYPWKDKTIIGRSVSDGFILVEDNNTGALDRVSPISFQDWQLELNGCRKIVDGKWVYAATPHNSYSEAARDAYEKIPQLFTDSDPMAQALGHLIEAFHSLAERQGDGGITQKEARCYNDAKRALQSLLPVS